MKVLIDTNIILDVLFKRPNFYEDSAKVFKLCEVKRISGVISALSIPNIMYILRKELDSEKTNYIITRNIRDFAMSKVAAIKPTELLERV